VTPAASRARVPDPDAGLEPQPQPKPAACRLFRQTSRAKLGIKPGFCIFCGGAPAAYADIVGKLPATGERS